MTVESNISESKKEELLDLVKAKIENLRPKLLDLSRRNPLISTRFSSRSTSHVRVVDELPDVLSYRLANHQQMKLSPLPALEEDPKDEQSKKFRDALADARLTDETYLSGNDAIDSSKDGALEEIRKLERSLKDRVRESLGLPPRQTRQDVSLAQRARNNGVSPSYDLPDPEEVEDDGRFSDDEIQTLLLPEDLERVLNGLGNKCRTWMQETGLNVMHAAFGFLEWSDPKESTKSFSPLILFPVEIQKVKTSEGPEFWVKGTGEELETNSVLAEKLRLEFGLSLPAFEGGSIEEYLAQINDLAPKGINWRVRRQVAVGVFPSARMAMYHDLDTDAVAFEDNSIILDLLGGSSTGSEAPFADEYDVDHPEVERRVPCLVMDADSSQFSAMVDVAEGRNLALEGPPGTGKSQTIVNAIAAAIADGKKVLFVAEKMAALDVVRARLEAAGLGEFVLALQAERSAREQVIQSVRDRVEMSVARVPKGYDEKIAKFKAVRGELAAYVETISEQFGSTGFTIYEIIGRGISANARLEGAPKDLLAHHISDVDRLTEARIDEIAGLGKSVEVAWQETMAAAPYWKDIAVEASDRFVAERASELAVEASASFKAAADARDVLASFGFDVDVSHSFVSHLQLVVSQLQEHLSTLDPDLTQRILESGNGEALRSFLSTCDTAQRCRDKLSVSVLDPDDDALLDHAVRLRELCSEFDICAASSEAFSEKLQDTKRKLDRFRSAVGDIDRFRRDVPVEDEVALNLLRRARSIVKSYDRRVLAARGENLEEKISSPLGARLIQNAVQLKEKKRLLGEKILLSQSPDGTEAASLLTTMRASGALRFLSPRYRKAKRRYLGFTKNHQFKLDDVIADLSDLVEYKEAENSFSENAFTASLFGSHFDGLETDFELFQNLAQFYAQVDRDLEGAAGKHLRQVLKTKSLDLLLEMPEIDLDLPDMSVAELRENTEKLVGLYTDLVRREEEFCALSEFLKHPERVGLEQLSEIVELANHYTAFACELKGEEAVAAILGEYFHGVDTPSGTIQSSLTASEIIAQLKHDAPTLLQAVQGEVVSDLNAAAEAVAVSDAEAAGLLAEMCKFVGIVPQEIDQNRSAREMSEFLEAAAEDRDGFLVYAEFAIRKKSLDGIGFGWVADELLRAKGTPLETSDFIKALIAREQAKAVYQAYRSVLGKASGAKLDELREELASLDREIIRMSRKYLRAKAYQAAQPPYGVSSGRKSTWTDMALIENEINKQQRFVPVRDLTRRAGEALKELKPCWMMSPLAVAQYLPKSEMRFDLTIIDEASQMPPEDAIGAIARSDQVMVVGDTNQLPPTSFFRKMVDDEDADEDETVLDESILEMANSVFRPRRRLRWHYRSRHSALIKFSNHLIYDDDLIVFPSAQESRADMGVSLVKVDGRYKSGTNPDEANAIVEAVLRFMRTRPNESLGVVTLNQKQRDLLLEEMQYAFDRDAKAAEYVERWQKNNEGLEEFFIKNLENVQGDERDVIFVGTVYGPEAVGGPVMQRFGPINGTAGKRRLNVLFSRAKRQLVTFSSMTAADITADEHGNPGAYMLKKWLEYSATGLLPEKENVSATPDSDFEIFVMQQIQAMGCEPVPQVGVAGYFIDIGVRHPDWPYGFVLGVECDGANYHASKSARDRDRLRQEVLEGLGWHFHRIWSTDWFNDPHREAEKLRRRIEERLDYLRSEMASTSPSFQSFEKPSSVDDAMNMSKQSASDVSSQSESEQENALSLPEISLKDLSLSGAEVGDIVRVRYLSGDARTLEVQLTAEENAPNKGYVHIDQPLGEALLGAEEGDEIEVLVGSYVRKALVERIAKPSQ